MSDEVCYFIEPLAKHHQRENFCCGEQVLDQYFQHHASQDVRKHIAAVFVILEKNKSTVIGFYTLSSIGIEASDLPHSISNKLSKYSLLPATLLGRLAVDRQYHGKGLGELLLVDALQRSVDSSKQIASMAIIVDAKDSNAVKFYQKYGFIQFPSFERKLFLTTVTAEKLIA